MKKIISTQELPVPKPSVSSCSHCSPKNSANSVLAAPELSTTASAAGAISGTASILGSWQVCHAICLVIVAALAALGITVVGMPLAFLTDWAVTLWTVALVLLLITIALHAAKKCVSGRIILLNTGILIAGVPFKAVQPYQLGFWIIGGSIVAIALILFMQHWRKPHATNLDN